MQIAFFDKYFIAKVKVKGDSYSLEGYTYLLKIFNYSFEVFQLFNFKEHFVVCPCPYDGMMMMNFYKSRIRRTIGNKTIVSRTIKIKRLKIFTIKDAYMQMLLHLNEDFDDDLLLEAINCLNCKWLPCFIHLFKYQIHKSSIFAIYLNWKCSTIRRMH